MNAKERATEIVLKYYIELKESTYDYYDEPTAIKCAIIHVKGIIEVLNDAPTSNHKYSKLVFYHSVLKELNQM